MKTTKHPLDADELNLIKLAQEYADEDKARELLESLRWPDGPVCPHCLADRSECKDVYKLTPKPGSKAPARKGLYCCAACRKQFSVTVGTVFEGSHVPISKWLMAMFIICSSKKSISANQLHRMLKITYKTAWFMAHRIRYAMGDDLNRPLSGTVEVDETFVGGKGELKTKGKRQTPVSLAIFRRTPRKPRVTIIAGLICKDAIVLASDGQVTDSPSKLPDAKKITEVQFLNGKALIAESGSVALSNHAVQICRSKARQTDMQSADDIVAQTLQASVRQVRNEQVALYPKRKYTLEEWQKYFRDENPCELMVAYYFKCSGSREQAEAMHARMVKVVKEVKDAQDLHTHP